MAKGGWGVSPVVALVEDHSESLQRVRSPETAFTRKAYCVEGVSPSKRTEVSFV